MSSSRTDTINCKSILSDRKLVPDDQIRLFCAILQENTYGQLIRKADGSYETDKERPQWHKLKFPLSKPDPVTRKLFLPKQPEYTYLCKEHTWLNADFVHQWFKCIQLEVGARLEILRASTRENIGEYAWDNIIKPLTRLHRLWMKDADVRRVFGDFCHEGFESSIDMVDPSYQEDGCEACILKRIGSHINTLHALQCAIKGRISLESHARHPNRLRLLRIVEPWIDLLQKQHEKAETPSQRQTQHRWITGLSEELYEKRKELELERHRRRRAQRHLLETHHSNSVKYKQYIAALDDSAIDGSAHDAENDIIDSYAALRGAQRASVIASVDILAGNIPEYPSYQVQEPTPRSEGKSSPYGPKVDKAYIESRYSLDTTLNNDRVVRGLTAQLGDLHLPPSLPAAERYAFRDFGSTVWPIQQNGSRVELLTRSDTTKPVSRKPVPGGAQTASGSRDGASEAGGITQGDALVRRKLSKRSKFTEDLRGRDSY